MKALDRVRQRWRITAAAPWIPSGALHGLFPADAPGERFDAITMLAVIEPRPASSCAARRQPDFVTAGG